MIGTFSKTPKAFFWPLIFLLSFPLFYGCGGGSAGTGTRDLVGRVILTDNSSPAGVSVTVVETGDRVTVGSDGVFSVRAPTDSGTLSVERNGVSTLASVTEDDQTDSAQVFEVLINPITNNVDLSGLDVIAKIEGDCDYYFENRRTIRQAIATPPGLICPLRVTARKSGQLIGGVPFSLEYRACKDTSPWQTLVTGVTALTGNVGFSEVAFPYVDDATHCVYRIVTPAPFKKGSSVVHEVMTQTKQRK
jgi:hypothetical protein